MRLLLFISFAAILSARAGLEWEQTEIEINANPGDKQAKVSYEFTNTGDAPVTIREINTSCSCTIAADARGVYESGKRGEIDVIFDFGKRKGKQKESVLVQTQDGNSVLTLKVNLAESIHISKKKLTWMVGDPIEAQTFEIALTDSTVQVKSAKSVTDKFKTTLEEVQSGKTYRVQVSPVSTEQPVGGTIKLEIEDPLPRSIYIPVRVRN